MFKELDPGDRFIVLEDDTEYSKVYLYRRITNVWGIDNAEFVVNKQTSRFDPTQPVVKVLL